MPKLLIIGFVWPEPKSSAAGSRMLQLITVFLEANYEITFVSACGKTNNAFDLSDLGIVTKAVLLNDSSFDVFVAALNPDMVLFDRFMTEEQFGWRVAEQCPNAIRLLDTEDLHCLRKGRHQALKDKQRFNDSYLFNDFAKREIASIYRSDLTLMISEVELQILKERFKVPEHILCYVPFMLQPISEDAQDELPSFETRQHFVTIGNFMHPPNYDAVLVLKQDIWPLIRQQLPKAELHIYGSYVSQKAQQLHNERERFFVKGFAEDAHKVLQNARVCMSYLRFGAGLKGKLVDAMQNGTPAAMSTVAAEGMFGSLEPHGIVEDTIDTFVTKTVDLYYNKTLWKASQRHGFKALEKRFNADQYKTILQETLCSLSKDIDKHRLQNFTGSMLLHHSMQSTKFMSRWIEAKNK
jgi:hypothetical protein